MKQVHFLKANSQGGHMHIIKSIAIIVAIIMVVLFGWIVIGKIAQRQLEWVPRCEDAEPIMEDRFNRRATLCVVGFLLLVATVTSIF